MKVLRRSFLSLVASLPFAKALATQTTPQNALERQPEPPEGYNHKCRCEACQMRPHYLVWVNREDAGIRMGIGLYGLMLLTSEEQGHLVIHAFHGTEILKLSGPPRWLDSCLVDNAPIIK